MKYCFNYNVNRNFKYMEEIDEIEYIYHHANTNILDFLKNIKDNQRVIFRIVEDLDKAGLARFSMFKESFPNLKFACSLPEYKEKHSKEMFKILAEAGIPAFFHTLVSDWTMLDAMKNMGVSDIYLVEDICFELDKAAKVLHEAGIKIRVFPNVCQSSVSTTDTHALKTFFIRPEDVAVYESYVDVMEFFGRDDQIKTYYEIYAKNKRWLGDLNEMIIDFNDSVDSRGLSHIFAQQRIKCGKKCMKGSSCNLCQKFADLSKVMLENDLVFGKEQ